MSVMYQDNFDIAYKTKIKSDLLIINQCNKNDYAEIQVGDHTWRMIYTTERGLSKSRNMALENAKGDICLFCDDDEIMSEGYADIISKAYEELEEATAIVFNINRINNHLKKTYYHIDAIRLAPKYRAYGSPMLAISLEHIQNHGIRFNELFGSGSEWGGGEDSLFEKDIVDAGLKIYEYPAEIATVDYSNESKWFQGYTERYFYNLGAYIQYRYSGSLILRGLRKVFTCYRLRREKDLDFFKKMQWMNLGERGIKKNVTYTKFLDKKKFD